MRRVKFKDYKGEMVEGLFHCFHGDSAIIELKSGALLCAPVLQVQFIDNPDIELRNKSAIEIAAILTHAAAIGGKPRTYEWIAKTSCEIADMVVEHLNVKK